jgi:hypothetical protein
MAREEKRPLLVSVQKLLPTDYQKGLLAVVTSKYNYSLYNFYITKISKATDLQNKT